MDKSQMSTKDMLEIEFPVMRYDITMPLLEGRVPIEGVALKPVKSSSMINKEDPKVKAGDFGLMDLNIGYFLPAIEAGWEIIGLPVFSKRKPVYQLIFCHSRRRHSFAEGPRRQTHRLAHLSNRAHRLGARIAARALRR